MVLSFSQKDKQGNPNFFVEKIFSGLTLMGNQLDFPPPEKYKFDKEHYIACSSKFHTIRRDEKNRWKAGRDIHFVINNRSKNYYQFLPVLKCISVQKIEIKWAKSLTLGEKMWSNVYIDGKQIVGKKLENLCQFDGFNSKKEFFDYFSEDFEGKIIHWTDLEY